MDEINEKIFRCRRRIKVQESLLNASKVFALMFYIVKIQCQIIGERMKKIIHQNNRYVYLKIKQHTYSDLCLLKYKKK